MSTVERNKLNNLVTICLVLLGGLALLIEIIIEEKNYLASTSIGVVLILWTIMTYKQKEKA